MSFLYYISNSKIAGKGVFDSKNLNPLLNIGLGFSKINNTNKPDLDYKRTELGSFCNHSSTPNLYLKNVGNNYFFITLKKIKKDKELLVDYNKFNWDGKRDFIK